MKKKKDYTWLQSGRLIFKKCTTLFSHFFDALRVTLADSASYITQNKLLKLNVLGFFGTEVMKEKDTVVLVANIKAALINIFTWH